MSTRCTIKDDRDEATGQGFHLYEDLADESDCVMLDLEGFTFETSVSFAPSGRPTFQAFISSAEYGRRRSMGWLRRV